MSIIKVTLKDLSKMIDHALLHPAMTDDEVRDGCALALKYDVATVCVKPCSIPLALEMLAGSDVAICPVIGFPHGNSTTAIKVKEAEAAAQAGGTEIDMVINIGKALGEDWDYVTSEIQEIQNVVITNNAILKVIFENDFLHDSHIIKLCEICSAIGTAFVKTSTGFGFVKRDDGLYSYNGATLHHLRLMRDHCVSDVQIKAAGGVRTLDDLLLMRSMGIARIGTSATGEILNEAVKREIGNVPTEIKIRHSSLMAETGY